MSAFDRGRSVETLSGDRQGAGRRSRWAKLGIGAGASVVAVCAVQVVAFANSPVPTAGTTMASVLIHPDGTETLTLNGQWSFPAQSGDCSNVSVGRAAGYAVGWNDASQPGNAVGTDSVGAAAGNSLNPADNLVHPTPVTETTAQSGYTQTPWGGCGNYLGNPPDYNAGTWGPISHTYPAGHAATYTVCVVTYDVHLSTANDTTNGQPKDANGTVAGGSGNNNDNSTQGNTATSGCQDVTPQPPANVPEVPSVALFAGSALLVIGGFVWFRRRSSVRV
jgi:hypothetical protein